MVLGHDFHSRSGYDESFRRGGERLTLPTWRTLLAVLYDADISPESCFFTNLYMGLRSGDKTTGVFPGASDERFRRHCQDFLLTQLRVQRPRLVITLGMQVPPVIAELSDQLTPWVTERGIRKIDDAGALRTNVTFRQLPDFITTVVALLHPSLRHASLRHRTYRGLRELEAERALLRDAVVESGLHVV
jgi:uracil-DNA glycosylase